MSCKLHPVWRLVAILSCTAFLLGAAPARHARADDAPAVTEAAAAYVTDAYGNVLYDANGSDEMPLASITKIMTAMVALDSGLPLDTPVTFVADAYQEDAQLAGYRDGDVTTFGDLLMVSLVYSGNDTATNLAYAVSGNVDDFVALMNDKAAQLGLDHTHFANPHGLEQEGHYSCAADLCTMGRYAMEHYPFIRQAVQTRSVEVTIGDAPVTLYSTDELMESYAGLLGIKTGKTESGNSFLGSARRDRVTLYSCALCCDTSEGRFEDTRIMLDWAFDRYHARTLSHADWTVRQAPWQDGFWLRCPVSATRTVSGRSFEDEPVSYTTVMRKPNALVAGGATYATTLWTQGARVVGDAEYRAHRPQRSLAWNPLALPLFADT